MGLLEGNMAGASEPDSVSTKQQQIAELAKQNPQMGFTSPGPPHRPALADEAYMRVRKRWATGVDGQTAHDYTANLAGNLRSLLERAKSGTYLSTAGATRAYPERHGCWRDPPDRHPDV